MTWRHELTSETQPSKDEFQKLLEKYVENPTYYHADHDAKRELVLKTLSDEILKNETFIHFRESEELFVFDGLMYRQHGEQFVREATNKSLGEECTTHRINEVVSLIKTNPAIRHLEHHADGIMPLTMIPVANGIYNLITEQLQPYNKDLLFFSRLPVAYEPAAECPRFRQFLDEVVDRGDQALLQEWLGYCLLRDYTFAKALLLVGSGRNGKSVFLRVIEDLLGHENVSGIPLQNLALNRFAKSELFGKYANIYPDLPAKAVAETGEFKILTGNDSFTTEKKNSPFFKMRNHAKLLYACNQIPESYDPTDAYYDRFHIITFPNKFLGDKADEQLIDKLRLELPGILNFAVAGLNRLLSQHRFSYGKSLEETRDYYRRASSTVAAYVDDKLKVDEMGIIVKEELYVKYSEYCRENKLVPEHKQVFSQKLPEYIAVTSTICSVPGYKNRQHCWRGIKFKAKNEEEEAENQPKLDSYPPKPCDQPDQPDQHFLIPSQTLEKIEKEKRGKCGGGGENVDQPDQVDQREETPNPPDPVVKSPQLEQKTAYPTGKRRQRVEVPHICGGTLQADVEPDEDVSTAWCPHCSSTETIRKEPSGWVIVNTRREET